MSGSALHEAADNAQRVVLQTDLPLELYARGKVRDTYWLGDDLLMASDDPMADSFGPVQGMMVSYDAADVADAKRVFDALTEGGSTTQALEPTFFSVAFGMCVDRFGTPWMVVGPQPQQPS